MEREEAIRWLTNEKWKNANNKYKKEWNEAFDMAIEALSANLKEKFESAEAVPQSEQYKRGFEDCKRAYEIELARSADAVQGEWGHMMIDGNKLMLALSEWWYSSFGLEETEESKAIHKVMDEVERYVDHEKSADYWIPCSERLPEDSGDYLVCPSDGVIEDYSDCRDVMIIPYDADCEAFGWWTERYDPISLGFVDSDFDEFEVLAWMPLPKPYREDGEV